MATIHKSRSYVNNNYPVVNTNIDIKQLLYTEPTQHTQIALTSLLCVQTTKLGGTGRLRTMHVKLMVDSAFMNKSSPPRIFVIGSVCLDQSEKCITSKVTSYRA